MERKVNMTNGNENTLSYRVNKLEECTGTLDEKVDSILTNHLPHIQAEVVANSTLIKAATAINIAAIILSKLI